MSTRRPTDPISSIRWIEVVNNSSSLTIPSFGLVRIVSVDSGGILTVDRPNADNQYVLVNGHIPIPPSGRGYVSSFDHVHAAYDTGDGTPVLGENWGAGNGSYLLQKNNTGFIIAGGVTSGRVTVYRTPSGSMTSSAHVGAKVYRDAVQSISDATPTFLEFTQERYDTDGFHDNSTNNSRLQIPAGLDGFYLIGAYVNYAGDNSDTGFRSTGIILNNLDTIAAVNQDDIAGNFSVNHNLSVVAELAAEDYVEVNVHQTSGGNLNINAEPDFWIALLGT